MFEDNGHFSTLCEKKMCDLLVAIFFFTILWKLLVAKQLWWVERLKSIMMDIPR